LTNFDEFLGILKENDFDEIPVDLEEFVTDRHYLGLPPLSDLQYISIKASSQIYKKETLIELYGEAEGKKRWTQTCTEVILQLGKGCNAPYTPIYNPLIGNWERLDELNTDGLVVSDDGLIHLATEAFAVGHGRMIRVRTALGWEEDVFVDHKYLSYKKSKFYHRYRGIDPVYQTVGDLSVGDRIAIGLGLGVSDPINIPTEHAELIGYWLGDGMLPSEKNMIINMDFCSDEVESIARYEQLCEFIGDSPTKTKHKTKNLTFFRHGRNSNAVALAVKYDMVGMRSANKRIPDSVWRSDNHILAATISKLWQTDGCVYNKNGLTAEFVSISRQLSVDVHRALLRIGVPANLRFRTPKSNFENPSEAGYVTVSSEESIVRFLKFINLLDHKNRTAVEKTGRIYNRIDRDRYYDRIVSMEELGEGEFWTRTVPDTGNFVGNGMISANSGKDYTSTISCAYAVYKLLCLKDPAKYYGKPPGDAIDIINIAINAVQANRVFFKGFKTRIERCPWFAGKFEAKANYIEFDKSVIVHSGHSQSEGWEGYNVLIAILDEISGFDLESTTGNEKAKTAGSIYRMYRGSVDSRFPDFGKVVLLSFPRFKNDYIQQRYNEVVAQKETIIRTHEFKIDPELPDDIQENKFSVDWEEDHIISYRIPKVFALRRPTWDVNPTRKIEDFTIAFYTDPVDALGRFACMPPDSQDAFFRSRDKVETAFSNLNSALDENNRFAEWFKPEEDKVYYIHVDLAQKVDRCAVTLAHVDKWINIKVGNQTSESAPIVVVDAIRWWTPKSTETVDFTDVKDYIISLRALGFNIRLVTFDRWNSVDIMQQLKSNGMNCEVLSVAKKHYQDMALGVMEERIKGPYNKIIIEELLQLRVIKDKIDHPRSGSKDLADATCGAIYNAIALTPRDLNQEVEIRTYDYEDEREEIESLAKRRSGVIQLPDRSGMPDRLREFMDSRSEEQDEDRQFIDNFTII